MSALTIIFVTTLACTNTTEPETKEFINTIWKLESFETMGVEVLVIPNDQIYQVQFFTNDSINGVNHCNTLYGKYELKTDKILTIKELGGTKKGCGDNSMSNMFIATMYDAQSYEINRDELHIYYGTNSRLNFRSK